MELREPRSDRFKRWSTVLAALILAIAVVALYLTMSRVRGVTGCVQDYAAPRTAAETALVDIQRPDAGSGRLESAYAVSCGELRRRGQLR